MTFQPGETGPKEVEIDLFDDSLVEATESFNVRLVSTTNPAIQLGDPSSVNILDNDGKAIILLKTQNVHTKRPALNRDVFHNTTYATYYVGGNNIFWASPKMDRQKPNGQIC